MIVPNNQLSQTKTVAEHASGWERVGDLPWSVQEVYGTSWNRKGVIGGGMVVNETGRAVAIDRVTLFDPASDTWSKNCPFPSPRDHPAIVIARKRLYAIGGARHGLITGPVRILIIGGCAKVGTNEQKSPLWSDLHGARHAGPVWFGHCGY